jgi:hypothetical protein
MTNKEINKKETQGLSVGFELVGLKISVNFFLERCHNQAVKELLHVQSDSLAVFETQNNKMLPLRKT